VLAPALKPLGVDPIHFAIIFTHNVEVGLIHPPVGLNLFVLATISNAPYRPDNQGDIAIPNPLADRARDHHLRSVVDHVLARLRVRLNTDKIKAS
jgi:hypothetical protein